MSACSDPWTELMRRINAAHGVLVLGFGQLFVAAGTWRRGTEQQMDFVALAAGLPVLVAWESGVREGVFASETWTSALRGTSAKTPDMSIVDEWARAVATQFASRGLCRTQTTRLDTLAHRHVRASLTPL
jgi:hypothetical protein